MRFCRKQSDSFKSETRFFLDYIPCECTVFQEGVVIDEVWDSYRQAKVKGKEEGYFPVMLIPSQKLINQLRYASKPNVTIFQASEGKKAFDHTELRGNLFGKKLFMKYEQFGRLNTEVIMVKVPVRHPWEVFLYFPIEARGTDQEKTEYISAAKYLYDTRGAVPVILTDESIDFFVDSV